MRVCIVGLWATGATGATGAVLAAWLGTRVAAGALQLSALMAQAQAIGATVGVRIDQVPEDRHAATRKLGSFRTSMLQDLPARRWLLRYIADHDFAPVAWRRMAFGSVVLVTADSGVLTWTD